MSSINWKEVIAFVLRQIANGLDKENAVLKASSKFNISKKSIFSKII
jgi:hypothetical protein